MTRRGGRAANEGRNPTRKPNRRSPVFLWKTPSRQESEIRKGRVRHPSRPTLRDSSGSHRTEGRHPIVSDSPPPIFGNDALLAVFRESFSRVEREPPSIRSE